jgi:cytochrome c553
MKRAWALVGLMICAGPLAGAVTEVAADSGKGQSIANKVCAVCHGADGNSPTPANPKLAGQIPEYIQKQLANFKPAAGKKPERENPVMGGMAGGLSDQDIRDVAAYFSAQATKRGTARHPEMIEQGRKLWRGGDLGKGIPACAPNTSKRNSRRSAPASAGTTRAR